MFSLQASSPTIPAAPVWCSATAVWHLAHHPHQCHRVFVPLLWFSPAGFRSHDPCCTGPVVNGTAVSMSCGANYTMPNGDVVQSYVCPDVNAHFFWDMFHPSQSGFQKIVDMLFNDSPLAVFPRGFRRSLGMA